MARFVAFLLLLVFVVGSANVVYAKIVHPYKPEPPTGATEEQILLRRVIVDPSK